MIVDALGRRFRNLRVSLTAACNYACSYCVPDGKRLQSAQHELDGEELAYAVELVVDAAGIVANFERMTRIADATGIPLDPPVNALASDVQDDLGLREFRSSAATKRASGLARTAARWLGPLVLRAMPFVAGRMRRSDTEL